MTSPRGTYGGGYYTPSFPDTPIYDSLVAERGTPQIAPIRVPSAYSPYDSGSNLPALPALPATEGVAPRKRLALSLAADLAGSRRRDGVGSGVEWQRRLDTYFQPRGLRWGGAVSHQNRTARAGLEMVQR